VELGLFVEPQVGGTYRRLVELAQWSEANGLDAFARSDHYLNMDSSAPATDALVAFGGVAVETSSIELVTLISPLTFRHPAVMAKSATTLDEISGGRFSLGVGTGWMESEHAAFGLDLPVLKERFDRLEEALAYLTTAFAGGGTVEGQYYSLAADEVLPSASEGLRIVVGGGGPKKTPTLAGRYADEYNMFVTDAETLEARVGVMVGAARDAGREPSDILISMAGPGMVYSTDEEHTAVVADRARKRDMTVEDYIAMLDARNVPHGTPERARDALNRMGELGVGRYYVQEYAALDDVDLDRMELVFSSLSGS